MKPYTGPLNLLGAIDRTGDVLRQTLVKLDYVDGVLAGVSKAGEYRIDLAQFGPDIGPGTNLKRLLESLGVSVRVGCRCNAIASDMDAVGADGVAANLDHYADQLAGEARTRRWPITVGAGGWAAKQFIRLAVAQSRTAQKRLEESE